MLILSVNRVVDVHELGVEGVTGVGELVTFTFNSLFVWYRLTSTHETLMYGHNGKPTTTSEDTRVHGIYECVWVSLGVSGK